MFVIALDNPPSSETSSRPEYPNEDIMYSFQSLGPDNQTDLGELSHALEVRSPSIDGDTHRDDDLAVLSEGDIFSDDGGSDGSWEITARRDGRKSPPTRR
jgi:hypothetical protein